MKDEEPDRASRARASGRAKEESSEGSDESAYTDDSYTSESDQFEGYTYDERVKMQGKEVAMGQQPRRAKGLRRPKLATRRTSRTRRSCSTAGGEGRSSKEKGTTKRRTGYLLGTLVEMSPHAEAWKVNKKREPLEEAREERKT